MFQTNEGVFVEGHQVGQQETVSRFNLVELALGFLRIAGADRMSGKSQCHIFSPPIISPATPLFSPGPLSLRCAADFKEQARIPLHRGENRVVGKNEGSADKTPRPDRKST